MNPDGSNPVNLSNNDFEDVSPEFSPDGSRIVFATGGRGNAANFQIYLMNSDGTNPVNLSNNPANDGNPSFSPDGSRIVFNSDRDGHSEVYIMNADGSNQTRLTNSLSINGNPAFSPDGSRIVFESNRSGHPEIFVMNADGSQPTQLTKSIDARYPSFSPDGSKIAFSSFVNGNYEIFVMNPDGSGVVVLTNNPAQDTSPTWGFVPITITDTTPPVITPNVVGTVGNNSWYVSDVIVTWSIVDNESPITNQQNCQQQNVTVDTGGTNYNCTATSAGGTNTQSVTIRRDATPPTLSPAVIPNPVIQNVSATATANSSDALSGVASESCNPVDTSTIGNFSVNCTVIDVAGNIANAPANYQVIPNGDTTPPVITSYITGNLGNNGWYVSDVQVSWNVFDNESPITSPPCTPQIVNQDTNGVTFTCIVTSAGGTNTGSVIIQRDATAPNIMFNNRTSPNQNGWNNADVLVNWDCSDQLSGVANRLIFQEVRNEGANQSAMGTCFDLAGNSASDTQTGINIDKTPPTITFASRTPPNPNGWNNTDVTTQWDCADGLSGAENPTISVIYSTEGANQPNGGTCYDRAGNARSATVGTINIDKTPPTVSPVVSPNPVLVNGAATGIPNGADALSGIDTQNCSPVITSAVGSFYVNCTATDKAWNTAITITANYQVIYNFNGFFPPVYNPPLVNVLKAGRPVQIKFSLNGNFGLNILLPGYPASGDVPCSSFGQPATLQPTVAQGSGLTYDPATDRYQYHWRTNSNWAGTCRQLQVQLNDGRTYVANFQFQ